MVPYSHNSIFEPRTAKGRIARDLVLLATAAVGFVAVAILCLMVSVAEAAPRLEKGHNPGGGLFLKPSTGSTLTTPAPELKTDVKIKVTGVITRVTVAQKFINPAMAGGMPTVFQIQKLLIPERPSYNWAMHRA